MIKPNFHSKLKIWAWILPPMRRTRGFRSVNPRMTSRDNGGAVMLNCLLRLRRMVQHPTRFIKEILKRVQDDNSIHHPETSLCHPNHMFPSHVSSKFFFIVSNILIIAGVIILILFSFYKYFSPQFTKVSQKEQTLITPGVTPLQNPDAQIENNMQTVCEYVDAIHEEIYVPDPKNDKIQKNIGYQNNKVGIYIYAEVKEYLNLADEMVNSNGGEWGYVLIPFNVKDDNEERWGSLFDRLKEKKLIPIIQLWDLDLEVDKVDKQIQKSAEFLNALKWPIKQRYVSVYNEPNDDKFWKGKANPEEYATVLEKTINTLKNLDEDFFVMNGAFNTSARNGKGYIDTRDFMKRMNNQSPGIFKKLDGWASHPYPQPNFSGSPRGTGRDSIRAYEWELNILKTEYGVKEIPVFITETGWAHIESDGEDKNSNGYKFNKYQVADNIKYAFEKVWLPDPRVVAITPFTIRYEYPFDHFSWITEDGNPYPQFDAVKNIEKTKGKPPVVSYAPTKILECKYEYVE